MVATKNSVLEALREPFPVEAVKTRPGGGGKTLDYVAIETVLQRLLDVAPDFSWVAQVVYFQDNTAIVCGQLSIDGKTATGVGAMTSPDTDMAVKSANSEAMKNAAKNGWGVALELWDTEYRKGLDIRRKLASGSEAALKQEVFRLAREKLGGKPTAAAIAKAFGVKTTDLTDVETLRSILEQEGVL